MLHTRNASWLHLVVAVAAIVVTSMCARSVSAQNVPETTTELTRSQLEYNNKGVELINKGEYDEALGYFQSSLALGEANVTYLNIGRTYTRMERCASAAAAFRKAEQAPAVASPTPDEVADILSRYRADLDEVCSARLRFRCPEESVDLRIDQSPATTCPAKPVPVTPGEHQIEVSYQGATSRDSVRAVAGEVVQYEVKTPTTQDAPATSLDASGNGFRTAAWVSSLAGGALLVTGLVLDQTVVASAYDDVELAATGGDRAAYDTAVSDYEGVRDLNRALFVAGGALAASSIVFWVLSSGDESSGSTAAVISPREGGASLQLRWSW